MRFIGRASVVVLTGLGVGMVGERAGATVVSDGSARLQLVEGNVAGVLFYPFDNPTNGDANLVVPFSGNSNVDVDQLFKYTWYLRAPSGVNRAIGTTGNATISTPAANTIRYSFSSVGTAGYLFSAVFTIAVKQAAVAGQAQVTTVVEIAPSAGSWTFPGDNNLTLLALADFDVDGFGPGAAFDAASVGVVNGDTRIYQADTLSNRFVEILAPGANLAAVGSGTTLRNAVGAATAYGPNPVESAFTGDAAALWSYRFPMVAGQTTTLTTTFNLNSTPFIPEPGAVGVLGAAGLMLVRRQRG